MRWRPLAEEVAALEHAEHKARVDRRAHEIIGERLDEWQAERRARWLMQQPPAARTVRGMVGLEDLTENGWQAVQRYWLLAYAGDHGLASPYGWLYGYGDDSEPRRVPNPQMHWRRPTYAEALERERRWSADPGRFLHDDTRARGDRRGLYA